LAEDAVQETLLAALQGQKNCIENRMSLQHRVIDALFPGNRLCT